MVGLAILKIFQHAITINFKSSNEKKMLIPIRYNKGSERKKNTVGGMAKERSNHLLFRWAWMESFVDFPSSNSEARYSFAYPKSPKNVIKDPSTKKHVIIMLTLHSNKNKSPLFFSKPSN